MPIDTVENPFVRLGRLALERDRKATQIETMKQERDTAKIRWETLDKEVTRLLEELKATEAKMKATAKELG